MPGAASIRVRSDVIQGTVILDKKKAAPVGERGLGRNESEGSDLDGRLPAEAMGWHSGTGGPALAAG